MARIIKSFPVLLLALLLATFTTVSAFRKSSGCGRPLPSNLKQGETGKSNRLVFTTKSGTQRSYLLHLPLVYDANNAHGLIFSYHGRGENGTEQERLSRFSERSINPNMLVVYPDGINKEWEGDPDAKTDDVAFTLELLDNINKAFCINTDKVYAAGKSNGGGFSANILACDPVASSRFAAFAGVAGAYYSQRKGVTDIDCNGDTVKLACFPSRKPVPIFEAHGVKDLVIPYTGGPRRDKCLPSIPRFMKLWGTRNGIGSENETTTLFEGKVFMNVFGTGSLKGVQTHYRVRDAGHQWMSTKKNDDGGPTALDVSPLIVDFFNHWSLDRTPRIV